MKWKDWLERWGMSSLKVNTGILEMNWEPKDPDRKAAWELYIELLTRVATQQLKPDQGDEKSALESIYKLFDLTRQSLKAHHGSIEFAKISVVVLNQIVRPFTAKWHKEHVPPALRLMLFFNIVQQSRGNLSGTLRTGLDERETEELLTTRDVTRAVQLVRKGLEKQVGLQSLPS